MMNENQVKRIFQFNPEYTFKLLGRKYPFHPLKFVSDSFVVVCTGSYARFTFPNLPDTIEGFAAYLTVVATFSVFVAYLVTRLTEDGEMKQFYETLLQIDEQMNTSFGSQRSCVLSLMASLYPTSAALMITVVLARGLKYYDLPTLAVIPIIRMILEVSIMKYLLGKRLRYIRSEEEYMDRIEDSIFLTRQLLQCNTKLNTTYCLVAGIFAAFSCQLGLYVLYMYWSVYVVGLKAPYGSLDKPLIESILVCVFISISGLLAASSSSISNEVDEMRLEFDVTYSARNCTGSQQQLIYVFLMELHHTPVQMSALGLFNIEMSSVSTVCATSISYLLVLIQYT